MIKRALILITLLCTMTAFLYACKDTTGNTPNGTGDGGQSTETPDGAEESPPVEIAYSEKLSIWPKQDGSYYVADLGYCKDSVIVVPPTSPEGGVVTSLENFHIGIYSFVTGMILPDTITQVGGIFRGVEEFDYNEYDGGYYVGTLSNPYHAFIRPVSKEISSITLHPDTRIVAGEAFSDCGALTEVILPDGLISICNSAFANCNSLSSVQLPASLTHLGGSVFNRCTSLTEIAIPDSVSEIAGGSFNGCSSLARVTIGGGVTEIGSMAFYNCALLAEIIIPDKVTAIGNDAFYRCYKLERVVIGSGVTRIDSQAFIDCTSLTDLTIGEGVHTIMNGAFKNCDSLTQVRIPDSVSYIGKDAFAYCDSLAAVYLGGGLETVIQYAFSYDPALTDVYFPGSEEEYRAIVQINNFIDANKHFNYK